MTKGSGELCEKLFQCLLEAGRLLFGSGFGLCHPSGPHSFCCLWICSMALRQTVYSSSQCSQHGMVGWVWLCIELHALRMAHPITVFQLFI